jgi:hypothetical protein
MMGRENDVRGFKAGETGPEFNVRFPVEARMGMPQIGSHEYTYVT